MASPAGAEEELAVRLITGPQKFLRDVASVFEIRFILLRRSWYWYLMGTLVFPIGMFYFASALAPDNPDAIRRAMIGTIVFGSTMLTTSMLGQSVIYDRFQGRLKLIITMPVSRFAYAAGILCVGAVLSGSAVCILLIVALIAGVDFTFTWSFLPIVLTVLLTMSKKTFSSPRIAFRASISSSTSIRLTLQQSIAHERTKTLTVRTPLYQQSSGNPTSCAQVSRHTATGRVLYGQRAGEGVPLGD